MDQSCKKVLISVMQHIANRSAKVVIYTTQGCQHCRNAKRWLKKHNILFLDFNVGKPGKIQKRFFQMGGRTVPLIVIGDQQFVGFSPQRLETILSKEGLLPSS